VASYTSNLMTHTLSDTTDVLVAGTKYYFKLKATNAIGDSEFSDEALFALASLPSQPSAPYKDSSLSSTSSIFVRWSAVADTEINTSGYKLYMDGGNNGDFSLVFDGSGAPGTLSYLASGLTPGKAYRFKVVALNFNGESLESPEAILFSCLPPSGLLPPAYESSATTSLSVEWSSPSNVNGCPVYQYELYRDDGAGSAISTLVGTYDPDVYGATITLAGADTSKTFRL